MNADKITEAMRRCMARKLTLRQPHETKNRSPVPDPEPQRDQAPALGGPDEGKAPSVPRITVRFVGYRVRPLDPDNFAGSVKDLLDGLRHAGLILGDEPWRIILETEQVKVGSFAQECTLIEIEAGDSTPTATALPPTSGSAGVKP